MFTGIIEEVGAVDGVEPREAGLRLRVRAPKVASDIATGDSVSVNGVCLTAVEIRPGGFAADVSPETVRRSTLGGLRTGAQVNLERALHASSRLGGHIVQGHVDGVGVIDSFDPAGADQWRLAVAVPEELDAYFVLKGSIAVDGISLTIAAAAAGRVEIAVIPFTYRETNLRQRHPGDRVNLETDVLAKYVEKMLRSFSLKREGLTVEKLREQGW